MVASYGVASSLCMGRDTRPQRLNKPLRLTAVIGGLRRLVGPTAIRCRIGSGVRSQHVLRARPQLSG